MNGPGGEALERSGPAAAEAPGLPPLYASVAPPLPVAGLFTYEVPPSLAGQVRAGVRVLVPFGSRRIPAMCVGLGTAPPAGITARPIAAVLEHQPLAGADILELARWVATQTGCSWGEALDAALPAAIKAARPAATIEQVRLAPALCMDGRGTPDPRLLASVVDELQAHKKTEKQARVLRILGARGGSLPLRELAGLAHVGRSPIDSLAKAGRVALSRERSRHDPLAGTDVAPTAPLALTADQAAALARVVAAVEGGAAKTFLLHGVTGSGKTEIYLQALARVVERGRQGIVLVPEIALTPQTVRRFRERFQRVAVLHSHLTDAERAHEWRRIRAGEADIVVGARSAVFAPVPRLGLVVLDEEHETSFKQQNAPRYHARDVAVERARLAGAVVLLGTATPSLEAFHRATAGEWERLLLPERVAGGLAPAIAMVDLALEQRRGGRFSFLSDPLRAAIEDTLGRQGQILLFLNRRGWAPVLLCRGCREALKCPHCAVSLTLHRRANRALCHYCGYEAPPPPRCPACGGPLLPLGYGTEKVEEDVRQGFPAATVARMDSDTMSGRGSYETVLGDFGAGRIDVLIGTQMIAKGLDFPNVLLVGVICADSALFLPDWRAAERTFQLLAQVVGRTGRGPKGGKVVVQAFNPRHFSIAAGVRQDYEAFARTELPHREADGYPPYTRIVRLIAQARDEPAARAATDKLAETLGVGGGEELPLPGVEILG
ncbi:MAG TPA: primosomal protein N', partial [Planctomycetota bacterium]|nr:primosomal protein N' [Planctomycetota bacterium]